MSEWRVGDTRAAKREAEMSGEVRGAAKGEAEMSGEVRGSRSCVGQMRSGEPEVRND